uniref:CSON009472 protein n=1 Tax=Culicoides sonorensis TaxID=179676 RepID=A0A336MZZ8_CULSO
MMAMEENLFYSVLSGVDIQIPPRTSLYVNKFISIEKQNKFENKSFYQFKFLINKIELKMKKGNYKTKEKKTQGNIKDNPILEAFSKISEELDDKHDRDITIESKRIIFLLHTVDPLKNNKEKVLEESETRLKKLADTNFKKIAEELKGKDQYQFLRAFTFGLQEYIEAFTFYDYIKGNNMSSWDVIQNNLVYVDEDQQEIKCLVPKFEHILGLGDLTGEVMRRCINSLGSGDIEECFNACNFLKEINTGFLSIGHISNRDFGQKVFTLKQSVLKCEMVCYNIKVRGGEAAKLGASEHGLFSSVLVKDEDEGFY